MCALEAKQRKTFIEALGYQYVIMNKGPNGFTSLNKLQDEHSDGAWNKLLKLCSVSPDAFTNNTCRTCHT